MSVSLGSRVIVVAVSERADILFMENVPLQFAAKTEDMFIVENVLKSHVNC